MTVDDYAKVFSDSKCSLTLSKAIQFVHYVRVNECDKPCLLRCSHSIHIKNKFLRVACAEFEHALRIAPPWEDYREVIARLEWPIMCRVVNHIQNGKYDGPDGEKWIEADVWFVEMWTAYHILFLRMPGYSPENSFWRNYDRKLREARKKTAKYRRFL